VHSPAFVAAHAIVPGVAVTLWLELLGVAAAVLAISGAVAWWQHGRAAAGPSVWRRRARRLTADDLARMVAEADALRQHAIGARSAAVSAEYALTRAQARSRETQRAREVAWHDYDTAQRAYANAVRNPVMSESLWPMANTSGAWPVLVAGGAEPARSPEPVARTPAAAGEPAGTALALAEPAGALTTEPAPALTVEPPAGPVGPPAGPAGPPEGPALPHDLSRAALAAFRRGDLSVEQLRAVFRRFSGWDARLEQHEREVLRRRAAERDAHRRYTMAAAAERDANHEVDVAMAAARAWADEAVEAAEEARLARVFVEECLRHAAIRRRLRRHSAAG